MVVVVVAVLVEMAVHVVVVCHPIDHCGCHVRHVQILIVKIITGIQKKIPEIICRGSGRP